MLRNNILLPLIIILIASFSFVYSQKVILISSSLGYYNIRQVNNIVKIYQHFRKNGFSD
jgi:glycosylphosphatidylinositol transamidase (GPIT) subunit GPI8